MNAKIQGGEMGKMYFKYDDQALLYLKSKDQTLGEVIDKIGHIVRVVDTDLFS